MKKQELIKILAANIGKTQVETEQIVEDLFACIRYLVQSGEDVNIPHFGQFKAATMKERLGYNPITAERVIIPEHLKPKFIPCKEFAHVVKMNHKQKY